jgi:PBP1b-binding outer membrane lipoprotein LpoB
MSNKLIPIVLSIAFLALVFASCTKEVPKEMQTPTSRHRQYTAATNA